MIFEPRAEQIIISAHHEASARRHEYVCVEHLLFALLSDESGREILANCGADIEGLTKAVKNFLDGHLEHTPLEITDYEPELGVGYQRVINRAVLHSRYSSAARIGVGDLLAAIFTESESHAVYYLHQSGVSRLQVLEFISHGSDDYNSASASPGSANENETSRGNPLEKFTIDLLARANQGLIDPLIGREQELERMVQILCRRNKNNPILVGDQGVGKTALAEGLALRIVSGDVPEKLTQCRLFSLDLGSIVAGTRYRGDFEQRIKEIVKALEQLEQPILFIDEIHTIIGAGSTSGGTLDASNLLKPVLTRGRIRCIGSTTYDEFKNHFEKDRALARRFSKIEVVEPSIDETISILRGLKSRFEEHHGIVYSMPALRAAVVLSEKYVNERFLPDKAIDVLDEAGAALALSSKGGEKAATVKPHHIEQVVAKIARIPARTVSTTEKEKLRQLEAELKQVVFGQNSAVETVSKAIRRARAGLGRENQPVGSFLFVGPTGVGKTEVASQVAKILGLELIRFDMSEYMEKHSVARLIGAPPGYVGFDQGGLMTDAIIRSPHSVLLLDEVEKAHPDLFNILLQVMDNATLTDNNGRHADFRNVVIMMTSNVGSEEIFGKPIGFGNQARTAGLGVVDKAFRPEFRNRLDAIVRFEPLPEEVIERIVDKFIAEIDAQLIAKKATIVLTPEARTFLAKHGFTQEYGARSIQRLIQEKVSDPIADALLFGKLSRGGTVKILVANDALVLEITAKEQKYTKKPQGALVDT